MADEVLITNEGVTAIPATKHHHRVMHRARDLLAANAMWGYLLEIARAGLPITLQMVHDVAEGVRSGDLPDRALERSREHVSLF